MLFLIFTRKNHFDIYVIFFQNSKKAEKVNFSRLTDFLKNIKNIISLGAIMAFISQVGITITYTQTKNQAKIFRVVAVIAILRKNEKLHIFYRIIAVEHLYHHKILLLAWLIKSCSGFKFFYHKMIFLNFFLF